MLSTSWFVASTKADAKRSHRHSIEPISGEVEVPVRIINCYPEMNVTRYLVVRKTL